MKIGTHSSKTVLLQRANDVHCPITQASMTLTVQLHTINIMLKSGLSITNQIREFRYSFFVADYVVTKLLTSSSQLNQKIKSAS